MSPPVKRKITKTSLLKPEEKQAQTKRVAREFNNEAQKYVAAKIQYSPRSKGTHPDTIDQMLGSSLVFKSKFLSDFGGMPQAKLGPLPQSSQTRIKRSFDETARSLAHWYDLSIQTKIGCFEQADTIENIEKPTKEIRGCIDSASNAMLAGNINRDYTRNKDSVMGAVHGALTENIAATPAENNKANMVALHYADYINENLLLPLVVAAINAPVAEKMKEVADKLVNKATPKITEDSEKEIQNELNHWTWTWLKWKVGHSSQTELENERISEKTTAYVNGLGNALAGQVWTFVQHPITANVNTELDVIVDSTPQTAESEQNIPDYNSI